MTEKKQSNHSTDDSPGEMPLLVTALMVMISLIIGGVIDLIYGDKAGLMPIAIGTTISIYFGPILGLWLMEWLDS